MYIYICINTKIHMYRASRPSPPWMVRSWILLPPLPHRWSGLREREREREKERGRGKGKENYTYIFFLHAMLVFNAHRDRSACKGIQQHTKFTFKRCRTLPHHQWWLAPQPPLTPNDNQHPHGALPTDLNATSRDCTALPGKLRSGLVGTFRMCVSRLMATGRVF